VCSPASSEQLQHPGQHPGERVILDDGTEVQIRPIAADDVPELVRFHEGLSFDTVYRRFFGIHPHLGPAEAKHFCITDSVDRLALVALVDGAIVAVARMERVEPASTAEVAFVVADRFQHHRLGRVLAQRLAAAARARGIDRFVADVLPDNQPMLHLLPDAGFSVGVAMADGLVHLTCPIGPPESVQSAPG
jgi:RimJ/RimL family protein N-acetyltransferase